MLALVLAACNPDPGEISQQVGFRDGTGSDGTTNGERGSVGISEVLWSGSVTEAGWDPTDVFVELRNESQRPVNLSGWRIDQSGTIRTTYVLPATDAVVEVGEHVIIAAKRSGCFADAEFEVPALAFPMDAPFALTLRDIDERLIDGGGSTEMPPFAGGYDLRVSRSMEKIELMFGGEGGEPSAWHYYTKAEVDVPNDDRVGSACRGRTLAAPGRPNSPDYSGAYAAGELE